MALQKNKIYHAEFTGYTAEGSAVAHIDGMTVFVPGGAVGDHCDVKILKVTKRLAYGKIERIRVRSKHRIEPACPHASQCGGCCYQHL
ncbi:MAG: TRAM domain-containing protein, partial [Butyricicoccus sp.]|nr:TRAM domain-containing protein [Butyricicoccus sp.]